MSKFDKEKQIKSFDKGRKNNSLRRHIDETIDEDLEIQQEIEREYNLKAQSDKQ